MLKKIYNFTNLLYMKIGYFKMGKINSTIANMCIYADNEQFSAYEEKLAESENSENSAW